MTQPSDSDQTLLTIAELARNLDLPESTTRYYCNRFAEHLPSVGEGRKRRYQPEALDKLRTIAETMRRNKNAFAVDLMLRDKADGIPAAPVAPVSPVTMVPMSDGAAHLAGQMLSLMENQTRALRDIAQAISLVAERLSLPGRAVSPPSPAETTRPENEKTAEAEDRANPFTGASSPEDESLRGEVAALREHIRGAEAVHQNDLEQLRKWLTRLGEALAVK